MKPHRRPAARWNTAAALLLAALIPLLVFWRGALLQGVYFQADLVVYYLPAYTYATRVLRSGTLPLWAPEMEGGQPFHAQWEPTFLYPLDVPFRFLLPPGWSLNLSLVFHYALAAAAMFLYVRRLSFSRSAALVSAAIYAVNGFMIAHLEHPNLIVGAAWLPLLLLAVEHGLGGARLAGALGIAAVLGMMLLGGHPDMFLMGSLLVGLLVLAHPLHGILQARRLREVLPPVAMLVGGYALGIALAAVQLLPTLELAQLSWRERGASIAFQDTWSLHPIQYLVQLLPDLFGRNGQDTYWGVAHYWEECTYIGSLALALAFVGLFSRHRMAGFFGGVAALSLWLAMGTNGLAFSALRQLPAFGTMRLPCRYMFLFDLSAAVLAGAGAHWLSHLERPAERSRALWLRGVLTAALGGVTVWLLAWWLGRERLLGDVAERMAPMHRFHAPDVTPLLRQYVPQIGLNAALLLGGLALALALVMIAVRRDSESPRRHGDTEKALEEDEPRTQGAASTGSERAIRHRRLIPALAFAGVVVTLFLFGQDYHTLIPARLVEEAPFTVEAIRETGSEGPFRILRWDSLRLHADVAVHRGWWPTDEQGFRQYIASLPGNYNLVWDLAGVRQEEWSALPLRHTRQLTSAILAMGGRDGFGAVAPYIPWWNTAFVISQRPLTDISLRPLAADRTRLYRTQDHGQRAWIVHQASFEADSPRLLQRLISDPSSLRRSVVLQPESEGRNSLSPRKREGSENAKGVPDLPRRHGGTKAHGAGGPPEGRPAALSPSEEQRTDGKVEDAARIIHRTATWVTVEASADREGYLVLGETWAPGWRAWRDGQPVAIHRANLVHRAVEMPAGRHRVAFRYEPAAFRLGLYLSLSALAALLALAVTRAGRSE